MSSDKTPDRLPVVIPGPAPGARPGPYEDEIEPKVSLGPWAGDMAIVRGFVIQRFDLPPEEREVEVITHRGARFLPHVEASDRFRGGYTLWALVPVGNPVVTRYARMLGTGDTVPGEALARHDYLDTFHWMGHVWHVFVTKEGTR